LLEVKNLTKQYPTTRGVLPILSDISFTLARGDSASIMGPSGSGKSTLLYVLGALEPPSDGSVTLDGQNPFGLDEKETAAFRNTRVGFVFQDHLLLPQCSVLENVLVPTLVGDPDSTAAERALRLIEQVGLRERVDHSPAELSGGERQRVALARALIQQPPLLLCDEPTGNLDRESAETVASLLFDLHRQQKTILVIVTHNIDLADRCSIRYRLHHQRLTRAGTDASGATR
jgi:lipoprotein-releasing system ATP-binding protein